MDQSRIAARIALSREIVDFLQHQGPAVLNVVILFVGSLIMLFRYDALIGAVALFGLVPTFFVNRWFSQISYRMNSALNNRFEREIDIIANHKIQMVRAHFERIKIWRLKLSNAEAASWGVMHVISILVAGSSLIILSSADEITVGVVYSIMSYVSDYLDSVGAIPGIVQSVSRINDIIRRIDSAS